MASDFTGTEMTLLILVVVFGVLIAILLMWFFLVRNKQPEMINPTVPMNGISGRQLMNPVYPETVNFEPSGFY